MVNTQTINILSLCTGYGGLELGLSRALEGFFRVVAVEVETYALANLAEKAQEGKLAIEAMWPDLKTFPAKRFRGCFDFVLAGFPCQPFSVAGKRLGTDDPRHLWPHIARIIQAVRPIWFFGENVSGHLSIGFPEVYRSLRLMGYKVEAGLFTAEEVGAPHKRERLFILAYNQGDRLERWSQYNEKQAKGRSKSSSRIITRSSSELANSGRAASGNQDGQIDRRARQEDVPQGNGQAGTVRLGATGELADTNRKRLQEQCGAESIYSPIPKSEHEDIYEWPARPGQPQYEWEEPRVVADSERKRHRRRAKEIDNTNDKNERDNRDKVGGKTNGCRSVPESEGQTQPRLGRAASRTSSRVDRLRLLGNGVVPQQAELAFRTLMALFQK